MLDALADDIHHRPDILGPVPAVLVDRIRSLVGDVEIDLESAVATRDRRRGHALNAELGFYGE